MKKILLLLSVITLTYASVGKISAIRGEAIVISKGNETQALLNQELDENDIIKTGNNARLQIIFNDNTVTTLGKNTSLEIKKYLLDGKNSKVNLEVSEGSFKVITGEISKLARKNFSLKAHTATIGIRGTVFVGEVGFNVNKLACLQGAIDVKLGNKTSLIASGKQISFSNNKIIKVEPLKVNDFSLTKANINEDNKQEKIQEKQEDKQSNGNTNNKITSITLSSNIKADNTNSNSKNTLQTSEQIEVKEDINEKVMYLLNKENNEDSDNKDNEVDKPDIPIVPSEPVYNKYFSNADNKNYYYSSNTSLRSGDIRQDAAELNIKKGSLNIYSNTKSGNNIIDFKKISVTNNQLNILKTIDNANNIEDVSYSITNSTTSNLDGYSDLRFNSNNGQVSYIANKEKLEANILDDSFSMLKDINTNTNYYILGKEWSNFTNEIFEKNKDYFSLLDKNNTFYYNTNISSMQLNLYDSSITYYFVNSHSAKKLYADFKNINKIYYEEAYSSGSFYDKQIYDINNKTISPINGSSPYNIQANTSSGNVKHDFILKADKNKAEISFGNLISSIMDTQLYPENRFKYHANEFNKYKDNYKPKESFNTSDKDYFYSGSGSSIKLNPAKQEVDSYVVYGGGWGNIYRVTFDKNIGDITYVERADGRVKDVKHSQKFNINSIKDVSSGYILTVGDLNNNYNFEIKADNTGAILKGAAIINGTSHSINSDVLKYTDSSDGYKLVKDVYDKAVQGK